MNSHIDAGAEETRVPDRSGGLKLSQGLAFVPSYLALDGPLLWSLLCQQASACLGEFG